MEKRQACETTCQTRWLGMIRSGERTVTCKFVLKTWHLTQLWDWAPTTNWFTVYCLHLFTISCSPVSRSVQVLMGPSSWFLWNNPKLHPEMVFWLNRNFRWDPKLQMDLTLHDSYWIMKSHLFPIKSQAKFQETVSLTAGQGRFQVVKRANEPVLTMADWATPGKSTCPVGIAGLAGAQGPMHSGPEEKRKPATLLTWFIVRGNWWVCNNPHVAVGL